MKLIFVFNLLFNAVMIKTAQAEIDANDLIKLAPSLSEDVVNLAVKAFNYANKDSKKLSRISIL